MLCDKCQKNQAVAHIKTVINGIVYEKHLCEECAEQEQINSAFSNPFSHLLDSFFENNTPICGANTKKCPNCNLTFDDILDSGKIGCSECYKTFENDLIPYLKRLQGSANYVGNTELFAKKQKTDFDENTDELNVLQKQLQQAVSEERFEDAAKLRDEINKLKEEK